MSTKRMSKTVIEGGRYVSNKQDRRQSSQKLRSENRRFSQKAKNLEDADDLGSTPTIRPVYKGFTDKLAPLYRWMRSKVGQKWNDVFKEMLSKVDTRNIAGRHIVYDHLLRSVRLKMTDVTWSFYNDFFVDEEGIFQLSEDNRWNRKRRRYSYYQNDLKPGELDKWLKGRWVMDYGTPGAIFWMVPDKMEWVECGGSSFYYDYRCHRIHRTGKKLVAVDPKSVLAIDRKTLPQTKDAEGNITYYREKDVRQCLQGKGSVKQGARFTEKDMAMWNRVPDALKERLLWVLPKESRKGKNRDIKRVTISF